MVFGEVVREVVEGNGSVGGKGGVGEGKDFVGIVGDGWWGVEVLVGEVEKDVVG